MNKRKSYTIYSPALMKKSESLISVFGKQVSENKDNDEGRAAECGSKESALFIQREKGRIEHAVSTPFAPRKFHNLNRAKVHINARLVPGAARKERQTTRWPVQLQSDAGTCAADAHLRERYF
jgi:hypothetical protein